MKRHFIEWLAEFHRDHADAFWAGVLMFSIGYIAGGLFGI